MRPTHCRAFAPRLTRPQSARRVATRRRSVGRASSTSYVRLTGCDASYTSFAPLRIASDVLSLVRRAARRQHRIGCVAHASIASQLAGLAAAHPQTPSANALHEAFCWLSLSLCWHAWRDTGMPCSGSSQAGVLWSDLPNPMLVTGLGRPDHSFSPGSCTYSDCRFVSTT
jgi:hypothetical protein